MNDMIKNLVKTARTMTWALVQIIILGLILSGAIMLCWNDAITYAFGLPALTFIHAFCMYALILIIGAGFSNNLEEVKKKPCPTCGGKDEKVHNHD